MSIAANASLVTAVTAKTSNNGTSRTNTSLFNTTATDDDLIELTLKEECDLSRVNALMKKDVADLVENSSTTSPLPTLENDDDIDKILSDELEKLTFDEREQIAFDVHGLSHHRQEDPTDVDTKLAELEHEIRKIRNRKDYEKAKYLNNDFVSHRGFRLLFLRCDEFDTQVAAQRIVKHFEIKREMFGDKCLARELRMSDLNEADMVALRSGIFHVLPTRDVAGRTVVVFDQSLRPEVPLSNRVSYT